MSDSDKHFYHRGIDNRNSCFPPKQLKESDKPLSEWLERDYSHNCQQGIGFGPPKVNIWFSASPERLDGSPTSPRCLGCFEHEGSSPKKEAPFSKAK